MQHCLGPFDGLIAQRFENLEDGLEWLRSHYPERLASRFQIREDGFRQYGTNYDWTTFTREV